MRTRVPWTSVADVWAAVEREWASGRLLRARVSEWSPPPGVAVAAGTAFPFRVGLRGPTTQEIGTHFDDVRRWVAAHRTARHYDVESEERTSRTWGRQTLPVAAVLGTADSALAMIGCHADAAAFDALVEQTPQAFRWYAAAHPHALLKVGADWPAVLAVAAWLRDHPDPGIYVRQVDLPGVHTKIVERHRQVIAALVDEGKPRRRITSLRDFERAYGFRSRPERVRFRVLDPAHAPVSGLVDVTLPVGELAALGVTVRRVVIIENEISMLAFPALPAGLAIWGSGNFGPELLADIAWLHDVDLNYWGDIDTHGFAILDRMRLVFPHARSLLMDEVTLLANQDRWGEETEPTHRDLPRLTDDEARVYGGLRADRWGRRLRLEQELLPFSAVQAAAVMP